jgi:peptidoglycan-associated lipoprotein
MRIARFAAVAVMGSFVAASFTGCSWFHKKTPTVPGDAGGVIGTGGGGLTEEGAGGMGSERFGAGKETKGQFASVYFAYDSSQVEAAERSKCETVSSFLKENANANMIVEGHCDERGSAEYNLALGERRALAVRAYLIGLGVDGARVQTKSYGEENPVAMGHDESSWKLNRRSEFVLVQ